MAPSQPLEDRPTGPGSRQRPMGPETPGGEDGLGADVTVLRSDVPFKGLPAANATFVDGAVPTLIDTGIKTDAGWASLEREAKEAGIDLSRLERILVTHAHLDHAGNAGRLQEMTGAEVCIHADDADDLRNWDAVQAPRNDAYGEGLRRAGLPVEVRTGLVERGRSVDGWMDAVPDLRVLRDAERIEAGDRLLDVIHAPGHTPGSALFHDGTDGLVVSGDTILERITPNALSVRPDERGALGRYMTTLRALKERPFRHVVPGHGRVFTGHVATIERCERLFRERQGRILGSMLAARSPATIWELVGREWPELHPGMAFLATSEIVGHMDILVDAGQVVEEGPDDAGVVRYVAVQR